MKQKGFAPILILVGVLILTSIVGGAYYLGRKSSDKVSVQTNDAVTQPQVSSIPKADETANSDSITADWKSYTNTTENYSFKYPSDWGFRIKSECGGPAVLPSGEIGTNNSWLVVCGPYYQESAQELADMGCNTESADKLLGRSQVEVNGNKAIKQQCKETGKSNNENYDVYRTDLYFTKKYSDNSTSVIVIYIYNHEKISPSKYQNQFDQILSTFKFIP